MIYLTLAYGDRCDVISICTDFRDEAEEIEKFLYYDVIVIKEMRGKITITIGIVLLLLVATITIDATDVNKPYWLQERLTRGEINEHVSNGWSLNIFQTTLFKPPEFYVDMPARLETWLSYLMNKRIDDEFFVLNGYVKNEKMYLEIYKNDVLVDEYVGWTDSNGTKIFIVTFKEQGYYACRAYSEWEKERGLIPEQTEKFYVNPEPTPTPMPTPTATPISTPSIPAFQIIPAIAALLAISYLIRRRK